MTKPQSPAGLTARMDAQGTRTMATVSQACAVRLIDRRTGQTHRINGSPLVLFTKSPALAVAELLDGRDAAIWEARVEPIGPARLIADAPAGGRA